MLVDPEDDFWLRWACITQGIIKDVEPWVLMEDVYSGRGWRVHPGDVFPDKCTVALKRTYAQL